MLGLERQDGFRWDALCQTTGRLSARSLREALPRRGPLGVLSWYAGGTGTLQAFAVREALSAARRGHDMVVLDLPRSPDALVDELAARCDRLLVVVVPTVAGVAAAARRVPRFADLDGLRLVLRGSGVAPAEIAAATGVAGARHDARPTRAGGVDRPRPRPGALAARAGSGGRRCGVLAGARAHDPSAAASSGRDGMTRRRCSTPYASGWPASPAS